MHLFHIPQCSIQNRNVHISVLNGALWDIEQVHSWIWEIGVLYHIRNKIFVAITYRCSNRRWVIYFTIHSELVIILQEGELSKICCFSALSLNIICSTMYQFCCLQSPLNYANVISFMIFLQLSLKYIWFWQLTLDVLNFSAETQTCLRFL